MADTANCDSEQRNNKEAAESHLENAENGSGESTSNLLLIVGEPFNVEQKDLVLERIVTELSSWDAEASKCDINQELNSLGPFKSPLQEGEKVFDLKSQKIEVLVLVNPTLRTAVGRISAFLSLPSNYKYLLYSGPTLVNSGSWLLQDGPLSCQDLCEAFRKATMADCSAGALLDVSLVSDFSDWNEATLQKACSKLKVRLCRPSKVLTDESGLIKFSDNLSAFLKTSTASDRLKSSDVQGSITFDRPTCYVFPAGQGNSLLFGVEGFTFLIDGGYGRNACFWDFVRHLSKVDGILVSRLTQDNIFGLSSFFEKKSLDKCGPEVGVMLLNIGDARHKHPVNGSPVRATSGLLVSIAEEGRLLAEHMSLVKLAPPMPCVASNQNHINLYYKVGHGALDLYVLNPEKDSKELKDFLTSWSKSVDSYKGGVPVSDAVSVACVLVWKPSPHLKENVVRILCPGRVSQQKLLESFDRLKGMACFHSRTGAEKVPTKKGTASAPVGGKTVTPTSARSVAAPKPAGGVKLEPKKVGSAASLEHKAADTKKADAKKQATPRELTRKPLEHGKIQRSAASPQKSPTKTTRQAGTKEPQPIRGSAERKLEVKAASLEKEKIPEAVEIPVDGEGQLSAKESKGEEAKEVEDVSSTAVTPSSSEEKPEELLDGKGDATDSGFEPEKEWGKPEGLPSPMKNPEEPAASQQQQPAKKAASDGQKSPDKTKKAAATTADKTSGKRPATADRSNPSVKEDLGKIAKKPKAAGDSLSAKSAAGKPEVKKPLKPVQGFYVDLTYVPAGADLEFFRKVRSQFYVLSSASPDPCVVSSLLEGKATWDDADPSEVSLVTTHESPELSLWLRENADRLNGASVKATPPASLCTIQLQDRDSSCAAYRLQL